MGFYEIGLPQQSNPTCLLKLLWTETLQKHLSSKPQLKAERVCFHKRNQLEGEPVSTYLGELKKLTLYCESGGSLNGVLRDRLVYGLHNEFIQKRLLLEPELTLAKLTEIALAVEAAVNDTLALQGTKESGVYKVINGGNSAPNIKPKSCGTTHKSSVCFFRTETSRKCGKVGHIQRVCRSGKSRNSGEYIKPEEKPLVGVEHSNQFKNLALCVVKTRNACIVWKRLSTRNKTRLESDLCYFKREATTKKL